jgi:hypothetical protein
MACLCVHMGEKYSIISVITCDLQLKSVDRHLVIFIVPVSIYCKRVHSKSSGFLLTSACLTVFALAILNRNLGLVDEFIVEV